MREEELAEVLKMPNKILFACDEKQGSVQAEGDLNKLGVAIVQVLVSDERMYKFMHRVVADAITERGKAKNKKT
jgi:hypothetical protein